MKLLAIGGAYVDINTTDFPFDERGLLPETEAVGGEYETVLGGAAVNFARLCVALGVPTAFVGKRGTDGFGEIMQKLFVESGIEPHLIAKPDAQTNISFNMANSYEQSIMAVAGTANQLLTPDDIQPLMDKLLPTCSHVFIGGCFKQPQLMPSYIDMVGVAKQKGMITVLDHGRLSQSYTPEQKDNVRSLAKKVNYYLPSHEEFLELWGVSLISEGLQMLAGITDTVIVVKDSSRGAWILQDGKTVRVPGFTATPLHTIGAGDSFNAGFIAAQSRGMNLTDSVRYGCATAAIKISQVELPSKEQVSTLISKN